ncbi:MAG: regulatory protein RecX [Candidatus Omnitrophica bacterium]|nr:regulatory protein RecX [Candidatus Omnitrophota bacterium]
MEINAEQYTKAKGYALRLFKLRPQSACELSDKLRKKGYPPELVERLTAELKAKGFIDDAAFARAWIQGRCRKYGYRRLARELDAKGIDGEMAKTAWGQVREGYEEEPVVRVLAEKRVQLCRDVPILKRKKRIMDYLARRGFDMGIINKVLREL